MPGPCGEACGTCYYWVENKLAPNQVVLGKGLSNVTGRCHKGPSRPLLLAVAQAPGGEPVPVTAAFVAEVAKDWWCGDWLEEARGIEERSKKGVPKA